jgi:uncharacterized protein YdaU (DUF1376 family)
MASEKITDTWMPLYIADYLKDTRHLSTLEHGAYLLLIIYAWTSEGLLPLDEKRLARIAGLEQKEWKKSRDVLLEFFIQKRDGFRHKRIDEELARASAMVEQRREAGRASAAARAEKRANERSNETGSENSTGVATAEATGAQRNGRPSPLPTQEEESQSSESSTLPRASPEPRLPADVRSVLDEGGFVSPPPDLELLRQWYALGADLNQDVLPTVRAVRARLSKPPFKLKVFDAAIREKLAADQAEIEHLRKVARRNAPEAQLGAGGG